MAKEMMLSSAEFQLGKKSKKAGAKPGLMEIMTETVPEAPVEVAPVVEANPEPGEKPKRTRSRNKAVQTEV